jgi:alkanesulfonate monooxygenase SsuD/methylene tetrahydromethanopterin reductase-like flavin-dependent oxidoreductase (luciferase family)
VGPPDTIRRIRFAISIPQFYSDGEFDPAAFGAYFARAEELGFDSAWAQEQVLGPAPQLGPIETMTYAAGCTQRLRLGCAVFVSTLHSPVHLAKSLATLDQLSRGRIEIGVGTGGKGRPFAAFGVDPQRYVARFTEGLALMKTLWTCGPRGPSAQALERTLQEALGPRSMRPSARLALSSTVYLTRCRWGPGAVGDLDHSQ